jgi:hypothetical protein
MFLEEAWIFQATAVVVPLTLSAAGTPVIPVEINGRLKHFWLDTGSSMSIIASDVAAECGVEPLVKDTLEVATSTGRVAARPAAIRKLTIGGISVLSSTAMIVSAELMEIHVGDPQSPAMTVKIDGIVGFDIISRMNVQVDYTKGIVRFTRPVHSAGTLSQRNFFWVGTPVVRLVSQTGIPLHLGLDTGAQETFATEHLLEKIRVHTFIGDSKAYRRGRGTERISWPFHFRCQAGTSREDSTLSESPRVRSFIADVRDSRRSPGQ